MKFKLLELDLIEGHTDTNKMNFAFFGVFLSFLMILLVRKRTNLKFCDCDAYIADITEAGILCTVRQDTKNGGESIERVSRIECKLLCDIFEARGGISMYRDSRWLCIE